MWKSIRWLWRHFGRYIFWGWVALLIVTSIPWIYWAIVGD